MPRTTLDETARPHEEAAERERFRKFCDRESASSYPPLPPPSIRIVDDNNRLISLVPQLNDRVLPPAERTPTADWRQPRAQWECGELLSDWLERGSSKALDTCVPQLHAWFRFVVQSGEYARCHGLPAAANSRAAAPSLQPGRDSTNAASSASPSPPPSVQRIHTACDAFPNAPVRTVDDDNKNSISLIPVTPSEPGSLFASPPACLTRPSDWRQATSVAELGALLCEWLERGGATVLYFDIDQLHAWYQFAILTTHTARLFGLPVTLAYLEDALQRALNKPPQYRPHLDGSTCQAAYEAHILTSFDSQEATVNSTASRPSRRFRQRKRRRQTAN